MSKTIYSPEALKELTANFQTCQQAVRVAQSARNEAQKQLRRQEQRLQEAAAELGQMAQLQFEFERQSPQERLSGQD